MFKGYWRTTPKFCLKLSLGLRGLIGTIAASAYVQGEPRMAFWLLVAGAALDFLIQCQHDCENLKNGNGAAAVALIIVLFYLATGTGCRTIKMATKETHLDSSWVTQKKVDVHVAGGTTEAANMDSLRGIIRELAGRGSGLATVVHDTLPGATDTVKIMDASGRAELRLWMDARGKMYADCSAKDQTIRALVNENNRLVRDNKSVVKTVYRLPPWFWYLLGGVVLVVIGSAVLAAWRKTPTGVALHLIDRNAG